MNVKITAKDFREALKIADAKLSDYQKLTTEPLRIVQIVEEDFN